MSYKLYSVLEDGSKILLASFEDLASAQGAQNDGSLIYSIEEWNGMNATVLS